jgi:hypothetical protein
MLVRWLEAELNRRYPDRMKMRPADAAGFREAWDALEPLWAQTVSRARGLAAEQLHERVDGEWSFIETLRHLVFATDAWVSRAILGKPSPWHPLDLPHDEMPDVPGVPRDRTARPTLDEVLALRADRIATDPDHPYATPRLGSTPPRSNASQAAQHRFLGVLWCRVSATSTLARTRIGEDRGFGA